MSVRFFSILFVYLFCQSFGINIALSQNLINELNESADLIPTQQDILGKIRSQNTTKNVKLFNLNNDELRNDSFTFAFTSDKRYEMRTLSHSNVEAAPSATDSEFAWVGETVEGDVNDSVLFVDRDGSVTGTISTADGDYEIRPLGGDVHAVIEIDPDQFPEDHPGEEIFAPDETEAQPDILPDANAVYTVNVLLLYTPAAAANYSNVNGHANMAILTANTVYENSGIPSRLRLAGVKTVPYSESTSGMPTDLARLQTRGDGHIDEAHDLRNTTRADLVHLIVDRNDFCGYAYTKASNKYGFGVTNHRCVGANKSFTHEIGHNFGGCHDPNTSSSCKFSYGYGYQHPQRQFRTIMAYNCPGGGCPRVARHSYPTQFGVANKHDVRRVIIERAPTVSRFRN